MFSNSWDSWVCLWCWIDNANEKQGSGNLPCLRKRGDQGWVVQAEAFLRLVLHCATVPQLSTLGICLCSSVSFVHFLPCPFAMFYFLSLHNSALQHCNVIHYTISVATTSLLSDLFWVKCLLQDAAGGFCSKQAQIQQDDQCEPASAQKTAKAASSVSCSACSRTIEWKWWKVSKNRRVMNAIPFSVQMSSTNAGFSFVMFIARE